VKNYEQRKNTATSGKLFKAVYASYVYVYMNMYYCIQCKGGKAISHTLLTDYETRFIGDSTDYSEIHPTEAFGSPAHTDREYRTLDLPILQQVGPT